MLKLFTECNSSLVTRVHEFVDHGATQTTNLGSRLYVGSKARLHYLVLRKLKMCTVK